MQRAFLVDPLAIRSPILATISPQTILLSSHQAANNSHDAAAVPTTAPANSGEFRAPLCLSFMLSRSASPCAPTDTFLLTSHDPYLQQRRRPAATVLYMNSGDFPP